MPSMDEATNTFFFSLINCFKTFTDKDYYNNLILNVVYTIVTTREKKRERK